MLRRAAWLASSIVVLHGAAGCSGDSGESAGGLLAPNVAPLVVNAGPAGPAAGYINGLFGSVTICVPGDDTNCQTIGGLLIDTGSTGLRILSSLVSVPLTRVKGDGGDDLANCVQFVDGSYFFGPVALANVKMAGEVASNVPIQIVADPASSDFAKPPDACANGGGMNQGTLNGLGANGILGVGLFEQDCGATCVTDATPGVYFGCAASGCQPATASLDKQVSNPVSSFSTDNNGVAIALPALGEQGSTTANGAMIFGIGTQKNNALGTATILRSDGGGNMTTLFQGQSYGQSAIDSGTNALYFLDAKTSALPTCKTNTDFYCPRSPVDLPASLVGNDGATQELTLHIANGDSLLSSDAYALDDLAGPNTPNVGFLFGLPFFYGRTVFSAIERRDTPAGAGPYWAY